LDVLESALFFLKRKEIELNDKAMAKADKNKKSLTKEQPNPYAANLLQPDAN
jgi:hypothetical protein